MVALLAAGAVHPGGAEVLGAQADCAMPFLAVEASFDVRSHGLQARPRARAGAVGVCSVATMVVLADRQAGDSLPVPGSCSPHGSTTSIPHVRAQIARLHRRPSQSRPVAAGDLGAVVLAAAAVGLDHRSRAVHSRSWRSSPRNDSPAPARSLGLWSSVCARWSWVSASSS